jgi:MFS family permease
MWHAVVLLVVHGMAGVLWGPASQLILHDLVGEEHLPSAVRLNATARQLGMLLGPAVGGGLMVLLGPALGILVNALAYLPLILWLFTVPRAARAPAEAPRSGAALHLVEAWRTLREVSGNPVIVAMVALNGLGSLLVGNAYQTEMPAFATALGADERGVAYSLLFGANAAGAVAGGFLLEGTGLLRPRARTAILCAALFAVSIAGFAAANSIPLAFTCLFLSGVFFLAYSSISQTLVQLLAPPAVRGRTIGLFNMAQSGCRVGSGLTLSVAGSYIGIHTSLALSAVALLAGSLGLLLFLHRATLAAQAAEESR